MKHLTEGQRYEISAYLNTGMSQNEIARHLGVHRSTISRELQRNSDGRSGEYKPELAQRKSVKRLRGRNHHRKFTDDLKTQVDILIRKDLSPEQIAGYYARKGMEMVSPETIYQYVWHDKKHGDKVSFAFADRPTLRFVGDSLVVNAHMYQIAYAADKVQRYTFGTTEADGISQPAIDGKVVYGENLTLNLGEAGATVYVYASDGKTVASATANEQGTANIPLSSLPAGVYIVKSGDFSTKILKR